MKFKRVLIAVLAVFLTVLGVVIFDISSTVNIVEKNTPENLKIPVRLRKNVSLNIYSNDNSLIYRKEYVRSSILKNTEETKELLEMISVLDKRVDSDVQNFSFREKFFMKILGIDSENARSGIAGFYAAKITYGTKVEGLNNRLLNFYVRDRLIKKYGTRKLYLSYVNSSDMGENTYGLAAASRYYFGEEFGELPVSMKALLVGVSWNFERYSLKKNFAVADRRRRLILYHLYDKGMLSKEKYTEQLDVFTGFKDTVKSYEKTPYVIYALKEFKKLNIPVYTDMHVYTYIDLKKTEIIRRKMVEHFKSEGFDDLQGGCSIVNARNGGIEVLVGSSTTNSLYRATTYRSQIGSTFKPIVYITALENGYSPATLIDDQPYDFGGYKPSNFEDYFMGRIPLRKGLVHSLNNTTIRLAKEVGLNKVRDMAINMGMLGGVKPWLPTPLGINSTTPLNVASAYSTLASMGIRKDVRVIKKVVDDLGNSFDLKMDEPKRVIDARTAYQVLYMMQSVASRGTARGAGLLRGTAAKTGTTDDYRDALTLAIFGDFVAVCRVGYDNRKSMGDDGTGGHMVAPIIAKFQKEYFGNDKHFSFAVPEGILHKKIHSRSTKVYGKRCGWSGFYFEALKIENIPDEACIPVSKTVITGEKREWKPAEVARREIKELQKLNKLIERGRLKQSSELERYSELLHKYGYSALEERS